MPHPPYDPENVFAKILRGDLPCIKVFEDEHSLAFMDIMPRGDGHTLVIPKRAARTIEDAAAADLGRLIGTVQKIATAVRKGMQADGITIQQFNESAGGQVVFHLHFHIIPRWMGVPLRPHSGEMANPEALSGHAAKIAEALKD
jgi:histidine triad (HIT) family protein